MATVLSRGSQDFHSKTDTAAKLLLDSAKRSEPVRRRHDSAALPQIEERDQHEMLAAEMLPIIYRSLDVLLVKGQKFSIIKHISVLLKQFPALESQFEPFAKEPPALSPSFFRQFAYYYAWKLLPLFLVLNLKFHSVGFSFLNLRP